MDIITTDIGLFDGLKSAESDKPIVIPIQFILEKINETTILLLTHLFFRYELDRIKIVAGPASDQLASGNVFLVHYILQEIYFPDGSTPVLSKACCDIDLLMRVLR